jgi:hypothetical protein
MNYTGLKDIGWQISGNPLEINIPPAGQPVSINSPFIVQLRADHTPGQPL